MLITDTQRKEFLEKWKDASIMTDNYRLIRGNELYNHQQDPGQTKNIAEQYPEMVAELRNEYEIWWDRVSKRSDEINPIPVGFDRNPVTLTCHDIHSENNQHPAWNQKQVRLNQNPNGFWIIDVKEKGKYSIALHRYPKESGAGFNSKVPMGDKIDGGTPYPEGIPIDVSSVKLKIDDKEETKLTGKGDINAIFEFDLEVGEQELKTWLSDKSGNQVGAYYVYVQKI